MSEIYTSAEDIAADLSARLASITVANGYETDIGVRSYRGRTHIDENAVPCSVLIEGEDRVADTKVNAVKLLQDYVLGGYALCDPNNPNDTAHKIIRDIKRAVFKDGDKLGGKVRKLEYKGRNIGPRADGRAVVFAVVFITIEYAETLSAP
jgi:hypothetical protein